MDERRQPDRTMVEKLLKREGERITHYDVARNTGIHVTHINRIFNGKRRPSLQTASKISTYLGCTLEELQAALRI